MVHPIEEIKLEGIQRSNRKSTIERWQEFQEHQEHEDNLDQQQKQQLPEAQRRVQQAVSSIFVKLKVKIQEKTHFLRLTFSLQSAKSFNFPNPIPS
ncbi:MAG: hypothetical protein LLG04_16845 [Parachlamydia sp.]|nr:hypothetical protein [Parachlamydia sp.]